MSSTPSQGGWGADVGAQPPGGQPWQYGQPGQPGPPPQGYAPSWGPPREHAPTAIASLVLGILGLVLLPLILSVPAIILGNKSKQAAANEPERYHDQLGQVGRILGWIGTTLGLLVMGLAVLAIAAIFVFPAS